MASRASFRLLRTGMISSLIIVLASGGHLAGGGVLPEPAILLGLCALTVLPVTILTAFRLSFPVLIAVLGVGQAWLHWAFHSLSAATSGEPMTGGHAHHASGMAVDAVGVSGAVQASGDWQMFAAHAVATVVTAVVLARGEQALWALSAWLRPLIKLLEPFVIVPARVPGPVAAPIVLPRDQMVRRMPERRGPPAMMPAV
ncbi:hypothetical protein ACIPWF_18130 [Paenarthrobacter sp. NPDC089989]|uniref:hypothetical protein n=1 Tax=unclassified Paenarthrobacter TaxID=2634190 RepID=UPI003821428C